MTYQASDWARAKAYLLKIAEQESKVLNPGEPTPAQIAAAMQLGFWDGCRWVLFTKEKHNFRILPNNQPETGGVEIVDISKWGDPPISHGP